MLHVQTSGMGVALSSCTSSLLSSFCMYSETFLYYKDALMACGGEDGIAYWLARFSLMRTIKLVQHQWLFNITDLQPGAGNRYQENSPMHDLMGEC